MDAKVSRSSNINADTAKQNRFLFIVYEKIELKHFIMDEIHWNLKWSRDQMKDPETRPRELRAIAAAANNFRVDQALIPSEKNEETQNVGGIPVKIRSIAEWLLECS